MSIEEAYFILNNLQINSRDMVEMVLFLRLEVPPVEDSYNDNCPEYIHSNNEVRMNFSQQPLSYQEQRGKRPTSKPLSEIASSFLFSQQNCG